MSVLENWNQWKDFLADRLQQAESGGLSQEVISNLAYEIGDYLAKQVEPKNPEEKFFTICGVSLQKRSNMQSPT